MSVGRPPNPRAPLLLAVHRPLWATLTLAPNPRLCPLCSPSGTAYCLDMPTAMQLATVHFRMSMAEALTASTINAASALGVAHEVPNAAVLLLGTPPPPAAAVARAPWLLCAGFLLVVACVGS